MESRKWVLRFNASNKTSVLSFKSIGKGAKTIETRAATEKYKKVAKGDTLVFVCGKKRVAKIVKGVKVFSSLGSMLKALPYKKINPWATSLAEVKRGYDSYTGYKEKLKKFGVIAFYI